jgi:hypothetical protein
MATSASQPYIAKLGFQDRDRGTDRHGLACEYLFHRLLEMEAAPAINRDRQAHLARHWSQAAGEFDVAQQKVVRAAKSLKEHDPTKPYVSTYELLQTMLQDAKTKRDECRQSLEQAKLEHDSFDPSCGIRYAVNQYKAALSINQPIKSGSRYVVGFADVLLHVGSHQVLGEVKITKESAETVLQQVNFYQTHLSNVGTVYILTDYDCSDLQRLVEGTHIKVYRLGRRFEQWIASRVQLATDEL